jgi:hypothetical protein
MHSRLYRRRVTVKMKGEVLIKEKTEKEQGNEWYPYHTN